MRDEYDTPHDDGSKSKNIYGAGSHVLCGLSNRMKLWASKVDGIFNSGIEALATNDQAAADKHGAPFPRGKRKREPKHDDKNGASRLNADIEPCTVRFNNALNGVLKRLYERGLASAGFHDWPRQAARSSRSRASMTSASSSTM